MAYFNLIQMRIVSLCKQRKVNINQLAKMSGVKQSTINNIVHGHSKNPKLTTIHKIANAFNMTLAEFLDFPELNAYSFEDETEEQ